MVNWKKGDLVQAGYSARAALQKEPAVSHVYYNVGVVALQEAPTPETFSFAEAVSYIEKAVQLDSHSLAPMHLLAWLRATAPEHSIRDGKTALKLAEAACRRTGYRDPNFLDTLAAAYAESGQFDIAIDVARTAAELARTSGKLNLESQIRNRLAFYQARTPYYNTTQEKFPH
jgi:tetratricopeptide (TPR) repeat protein